MSTYNFISLLIAFAAIIVFAIIAGVIDLMGEAFKHGQAQVMAPAESPRAVVAQVAAEHALARSRMRMSAFFVTDRPLNSARRSSRSSSYWSPPTCRSARRS